MPTLFPPFLNRGGNIGLTAICNLLFASRPAAVARLIVSVIVDAVQRMKARRPWSHICEKVGEAGPPLTDFDSSASVVLPVSCARVVAARAHINPSVVLRQMFSALRRTMHKVLGNHSVTVKTTATHHVFIDQMVSEHRVLCAAFAPTNPSCFSPVIIRAPRQNGQPYEFSPKQ